MSFNRFQRSELLSILLTPAPSDARKRLPSESNYDLASSIREEVSLSLHQHMGEWTCYFLTQITTFFLPAGIVGVVKYVCVRTYMCVGTCESIESFHRYSEILFISPEESV